MQDEPTSGLDSYTAHQVMEVVKSLVSCFGPCAQLATLPHPQVSFYRIQGPNDACISGESVVTDLTRVPYHAFAAPVGNCRGLDFDILPWNSGFPLWDGKGGSA